MSATVRRMQVQVSVATFDTRITRDVDVVAPSDGMPDSEVFAHAAADIAGQIAGMLRGLEPPTITDASREVRR